MLTSEWRNFTTNPEAIASTFGEADPSLEDIRLMRLELSEDGPTLNLSLALNDYPSNPPVRWKRGSNDSVTIQLQCLDLVNLSLSRSSGDSVISCKIGRGKAASVQIFITGKAIEASIQCNFVRINHVAPYLKG